MTYNKVFNLKLKDHIQIFKQQNDQTRKQGILP
jgi:hypothetical protein